jgi:hypothetical protein
VASEVTGAHLHDYADAFEVTVDHAVRWPAERWARVIFEGAPPPIRVLLLMGWRVALGFRLGPRDAPDHVLGWRITDREPNAIGLGLESSAMTAQVTVAVDSGAVCQSTWVGHRGWVARARWALVGPVHRLLVPYLLGRAATDHQLATDSCPGRRRGGRR